MDLLVEKLDGSRYYLSQYKVLITDFEESAPSVTRNSKQLDQRNGNIDFGGWHTDKTINITGYYRADDMDEEEALREKLYALLSDPDGYYITQLKTSPETAVERPGETSGSYYDKLTDYPSHKRFLVYTEAPELELVGNVNGTLLYKLTVEFKTIKLPYGETPAKDIAIDSPYAGLPDNLLLGTVNSFFCTGKGGENESEHAYSLSNTLGELIPSDKTPVTLSFDYTITGSLSGSVLPQFDNTPWGGNFNKIPMVANGHYEQTVITWSDYLTSKASAFQFRFDNFTGNFTATKMKFAIGTSTPPSLWSPNSADPEYNSWYYGLAGNVSIPYSGTVPCNQLEQQFAIELTAKGTSSSLSFKIDDTELTYSGAVASGDVFLLTGFSYTQNGLSIVSKTNKAYFILQPDKSNRITCNVPGTVRILGFQNLYA